MAATRKRQTQRKVIDVEPRRGGRWAVQTRGTSRASRVFDSKASAVNDAARRAKNASPSEVIIKNEKGRIQSERTYGGDPTGSKG